jgi:vacuolar-type H+-ATPase subunit I/STV1
MTLHMTDAHKVLRQVPETLRGLSKHAQALETENTELRDKVAQYELRDRAVKLATVLEEKGLNEDLSFEEKVAALMDEPDKLELREEAAKIAAQQMSLGELDEDRPGNGGSTLEHYILGE